MLPVCVWTESLPPSNRLAGAMIPLAVAGLAHRIASAALAVDQKVLLRPVEMLKSIML